MNKNKKISLLIKQILDLTIAFFLLVILIPLFAFIAIYIRFFSPGEVFFKQKRIGYRGQEFIIYKFRTMLADSEKKYKKMSLYQYRKFGNDILYTVNDPRITIAGKLLRKLALDELPQLLNIIKGDMSFVGPRPLIKPETKLIKNYDLRVFSMKPGLTGLWQIKTRNRRQTLKEKTQYDLYYIENWSLLLDIKIVLKTIKIILLELFNYKK